MTVVTQPLRDEHNELFPHVDQLRAAADSVGENDPATLAAVREALDFLEHHLIPHAEAEDRALYPVVARIMGAPDATATMRRDHAEVGKLTTELGMLREELAMAGGSPFLYRELRRVLYGLFALVELHFAKEEEVYLPILDANLTAEQAADLFKQMEAAAGHAQRHVHAG
jgi:iron-sulfur cluster repair protein YtfE (RIC family)